MTIAVSPIAVEGPYAVLEGETVKWAATLKDENGDAVPLANITTAVLDLALLDGTIINGRDDQDVKNENNVTIHATNGAVTWRLVVDDLLMQDEGKSVEIHRATFRFAYSDGVADRVCVHQVDFSVQQVLAL